MKFQNYLCFTQLLLREIQLPAIKEQLKKLENSWTKIKDQGKWSIDRGTLHRHNYENYEIRRRQKITFTLPRRYQHSTKNY